MAEEFVVVFVLFLPIAAYHIRASLLRSLVEPLYHVGFDPVVGVHMEDEFPCGLPHSGSAGLWQTHVVFVVDDFDVRLGELIPHGGQHLHGAIFRAVVDEDDFHALESLREQRACTTFDVALHAIDRHDDRNFRCRDSVTVHSNSFVHSK